MARISTIQKLPAEVIQQLNARLVEHKFSGYEDHAAWLATLGHEVSKSSIHRYASTFEASIRCVQRSVDDPTEIEARLRCLEAASRSLPAHDSKGLINHAESLLKWVYAS
jgi:hypothetical protein